MITQSMVDEALRVATEENGYSFDGMTAHDIAVDLCDYNSWPASVSIDAVTVEAVLPLVECWLKSGGSHEDQATA